MHEAHETEVNKAAVITTMSAEVRDYCESILCALIIILKEHVFLVLLQRG